MPWIAQAPGIDASTTGISSGGVDPVERVVGRVTNGEMPGDPEVGACPGASAPGSIGIGDLTGRTKGGSRLASRVTTMPSPPVDAPSRPRPRRPPSRNRRRLRSAPGGRHGRRTGCATEHDARSNDPAGGPDERGQRRWPPGGRDGRARRARPPDRTRPTARDGAVRGGSTASRFQPQGSATVIPSRPGGRSCRSRRMWRWRRP